MENKEIRETIEKKRLRYWEVAREVGIDPATLSRWLRVELDDEKRQRVQDAIDKLI